MRLSNSPKVLLLRSSRVASPSCPVQSLGHTTQLGQVSRHHCLRKWGFQESLNLTGNSFVLELLLGSRFIAVIRVSEGFLITLQCKCPSAERGRVLNVGRVRSVLLERSLWPFVAALFLREKIRRRHKQQCGECQREREVGEAEEGKGGINGDGRRLDFEG